MVEYETLLSKYKYAEIRFERSFDSAVNIKDGEVRHSVGSSEGVSVRVLENGSWGFASSSSKGDTEKLLLKAQKLARLSKGKIGIGKIKAEKARCIEKTPITDIEQQIKVLLEAAKEMKGKNVSSRLISCTDSRLIKEFYSSLGAEVVQETGYAYLSCSTIAKSGDVIQRGSERTWSRSGFGEINATETAIKSKEKALRLIHASAPPKGRFTVVFDPEMAGVFSHEAIGHACEADSITDRESILAGRIGEKIGNELVSIVDDPGAGDFGGYRYDDEGTSGQKVTLIEKGYLRGYMNSMETANELGHFKNGHARAGGVDQFPIVRMSNTYFQKGNHSEDEVFDIGEGIYLKGMKGGSVDIFSGGFMFKAEEAYEIKKGEKERVMRDATITGNILQTMLNVQAVGKDWGTSPGMCGKFGQLVPVSDGGPHIRVADVTVG